MFDLAYEHNFMGWKTNDELAYGWAKRGEMGYKIGKGVGYYVGLAIATYFTAGAAAGAVAAGNAGAVATTIASASTTTIQAGFVAAGSLGKNTQANYNAAVEVATAEGREVTMGEIGSSIAKAGGKAVIEGGTIYLAGAAGSKLGDLSKASKVTALAKHSTAVKNVTSVGVKTTKAYIAEGYDCLINGEEYNWSEANADAISTVIAETAAIGATSLFDKGVEHVVKNKVLSEGIGRTSNGVDSTAARLGGGASTNDALEAAKIAIKNAKKTFGYIVSKEITKRFAKNTTSELISPLIESVV